MMEEKNPLKRIYHWKMIYGFQFLLIAFLLLMSCNKNDCCPGLDPTDPVVDLASERMKMANHVAENFIKPAFVNLTTSIQELDESLVQFESDQSESALMNLRSALKESWLDWQDAAIYQMGPTENNALRAAINLYPCDEGKIESNISSGVYTFGSISNKGAEGFPAVDYLINNGSDSVVLSGFMGTGRLEYLRAVIDATIDLVAKVSNQWNTGAFLNDFVSEQSAGTDVGSGIGLLTNAIDLHFQRFLRDGKVAIPAGVRSAGVPRPTTVESRYGEFSGELLVRGVEAYLNLFEGNGLNGQKGPSYFSYLENINQKSIADDLRSGFTDALMESKTLSNSFVDQIENNNEAMVEMFLSLQEIVTIIKSDMASVIGITITNQDNDGD